MRNERSNCSRRFYGRERLRPVSIYKRQHGREIRWRESNAPVVIRLERTRFVDAQIFALVIRQFCQMRIECWQMKAGNILVYERHRRRTLSYSVARSRHTHFFRQQVDVTFVTIRWSIVEFNQSESLQRERDICSNISCVRSYLCSGCDGHDEGWYTGTAQIHDSTLRIKALPVERTVLDEHDPTSAMRTIRLPLGQMT